MGVFVTIVGMYGILQSRTGSRLRATSAPARTSFFLVLFVFASLLPAASAQFTQQGGKLVGTGATETPAQQGSSVAISADGSTAIVGGPCCTTSVGAAWVYTRAGAAWSLQGSKLVGTGVVGALMQGASVALSADGNTAIVGGPGDNGGIGAAWVFTRSGGVWTQQGAKLVGNGAVGKSSQGDSVKLSGDGNTAIVGGNTDNTNVGAAWVYTRSGGVWTQQGGKLVGTGAAGIAKQGISVGLSGDGNTAILGGSPDNDNVGAAWVFTRTGGVWSQQGGKLVGTGASGGIILQGVSVALSGDGNTAIVGGLADNSAGGAAWVYIRSGGVWSQQGGKLVGAGAVGSAQQGISVGLSTDGNTAIIGGSADSNSLGAAWVFNRTGVVWGQQGNKLVGTGAVGTRVFQGQAVAISGDGSTAIIGGPGDNSSAGAAWVFARAGTVSNVPSFTADGVVNGASFLQGVAANSWFTIQGTNLSSATDTWDKTIVNGNLPTMLDGVSVSIGGKPAYIYYVSPGQINGIAPDLGNGSVAVTVMNLNGTSAPVNVSAQSIGPAFFLWANKYSVATRQDFSWAVKNGTFQGVTTVAAKPGDVIILWGTGFGPTAPAAPVGVQIPADQTYATANPVSITVGGIPAQVYGAALASGFTGLYQVAIQIPTSAPDGDLPVVATLNGVQSPATTLIAVQH